MKFIETTIERLGGIEPALGDEFDPLSKRDVSAIEKAIKGAVPPAFGYLLLTYGAFRFSEYVYYSPQKTFPKFYSKDNQGILGTFFGKKNDRFPKAKSISLLRVLSLLEEEWAADFLPVADNGAGDIVGVRLGSGNVELWIHDAPEGKDVCFVNKSFENWFSKLEN